jgi:hypothetical protein
MRTRPRATRTGATRHAFRRAILALGLCVLLVAFLPSALAGCGASADDTQADSRSPAPSSSLELTVADLAGDYPMTTNSFGGKEIGPAVVLFPDGTYKWFGMSPYVPVSEGAFVIEGDTITLTETGGGTVQTLRVAGETLIVDTGGELAPAGDEYTRREGSSQ